MGDVYHEIADRQGYIEKVIGSEEDKFRSTLQSGLQRLEDQIAIAAATPGKKLDGEARLPSTTPTASRWSSPARSRRRRGSRSIWRASRRDGRAAQARQGSQRFRQRYGSAEGSVLLELEKTIEPTKFVGLRAVDGPG